MNIACRTIFSPALIAGFFIPMDKTCDFVVNEEGGGGGGWGEGMKGGREEEWVNMGYWS